MFIIIIILYMNVCVCVCVLLAGGLLAAVLLGVGARLSLLFRGDVSDSLGQLGPCAGGPEEAAAPYMQTENCTKVSVGGWVGGWCGWVCGWCVGGWCMFVSGCVGGVWV